MAAGLGAFATGLLSGLRSAPGVRARFGSLRRRLSTVRRVAVRVRVAYEGRKGIAGIQDHEPNRAKPGGKTETEVSKRVYVCGWVAFSLGYKQGVLCARRHKFVFLQNNYPRALRSPEMVDVPHMVSLLPRAPSSLSGRDLSASVPDPLPVFLPLSIFAEPTRLTHTSSATVRCEPGTDTSESA